MPYARIMLTLLLAVSAAACSASGGENTPRPQANVITSDEIQTTQFRSAFELIRALRPQWLTGTGQSLSNQAAGQLVVYVDGIRMGGPEHLRQIPTTDMRSARWLSSTEAGTRYGTGHAGGVVEIVTRR
jgi:outer membrane receptor for ferrienterochelin and colicin